MLVAGHFQRGAVGADMHAGDVGRLHAEGALQFERTVDGGEGVSAAGVVLEGHAGDVKIRAERGCRLVPVGAVAHGAAEAGFALEHVERTGYAFARGERGEQSCFRGVAGVQGLGHRIHAEGLLQARGERRDRGKRVRKAFCIQAVDGGSRGRGAEAADGAGVVPVAIMRAPHGRADARGYLVADDDAAQEGLAARAAFLGHRQGGGDGRRARMVDRVAVDVVHLHGVRGGGVDQRRGSYRGFASEREPRPAAVEVFGERFFQQRRRRRHRAGQERRIPVDHRTLGVMQHFGRNRLRAEG